MSFIRHIHNYTEYNQQWNVFSAFNPSKCTHTGSSGQPTLQGGFGALPKGLISVVDTFCQSRDSNPQPWVTSGFKSNALSIKPRLPPQHNGHLTAPFLISHWKYSHCSTWKINTLSSVLYLHCTTVFLNWTACFKIFTIYRHVLWHLLQTLQCSW